MGFSICSAKTWPDLGKSEKLHFLYIFREKAYTIYFHKQQVNK